MFGIGINWSRRIRRTVVRGAKWSVRSKPAYRPRKKGRRR